MEEMELKIKCPYKDKEFKKYWNMFLPKLMKRNNFHQVYSKNLEILCQLYVEYDKLTQVLKEQGFSYVADGRYGTQIKTRPEALEKDKICSQILKYSKILNLTLDPSEKTQDVETW